MAITQISVDTTENKIRHYMCNVNDLLGDYPTDCDAGSTMTVMDARPVGSTKVMDCIFDGVKWEVSKDEDAFKTASSSTVDSTDYITIDVENKPVHRDNIVIPIDVPQVETAITVATNGITKAGNATVVVTADDIEGSPITLSVPVVGTKQVETATVEGLISKGGNAKVTVTATGVTDFTSPTDFTVAVTGEKQVETATVDGTVTGDGNAKVTLTCADVTGITSPKEYLVDVDDGVAQAKKIALEGAVTKDGTIIVTVNADGVTGFSNSKDYTIDVIDGTAQVETAVIVGDITTSGNATVTVTANGVTGLTSPKEYSVAVEAGTAQVETATIVGTITSAGNAKVTVTADGVTGFTSPTDFSVEVAEADDASAVAGKIRTALGTSVTLTNTTDGYTVGGSGATVTLTRKTNLANDITLNIAVTNDTCVGLVPDSTSNHTTAGVYGDLAIDVAEKIRTALSADTDLTNTTDGYAVSGTGANVVLTRKVNKANDGGLNIAYTNGTCQGLTPDASSNNTTAGVAFDSAIATASKIRTILSADPSLTNDTDGYTVSGSTNEVILTRKVKNVNDATLNIALNNGTSEGITEITNSTVVSVASPADSASVVAEKIRTALSEDADLTNDTDGYTVSGTGADIVLTRKVALADDATLNIALDNGTCTGLTKADNSTNTTAGAVGLTASEVGALIRTALGNDSNLTNATDGYVITGEDANIILTRVYAKANDSALNIAITNDTCEGLTIKANSTNTTAGVAGDTASQIATKIKASLNGSDAITDIYTVGGTDANVVLTRILPTTDADDSTLNISIANGTCEGIVDDTSSNNTQGSGADNKTIQLTGLPRDCELTVFMYCYRLPSTITFTNVLWNGGIAPTFALGLNVIKLYTNDGGTTIFGEAVIGANPS